MTRWHCKVCRTWGVGGAAEWTKHYAIKRREQAIRDCIAAVEAAPISGGMQDPFTGQQRVEMFVGDAIAALRALLEGEQ